MRQADRHMLDAAATAVCTAPADAMAPPIVVRLLATYARQPGDGTGLCGTRWPVIDDHFVSARRVLMVYICR
jgi:hypothetical protein